MQNINANIAISIKNNMTGNCEIHEQKFFNLSWSLTLLIHNKSEQGLSPTQGLPIDRWFGNSSWFVGNQVAILVYILNFKLILDDILGILKRCKCFNIYQIVTAWWFKTFCPTKPVISTGIIDWHFNKSRDVLNTIYILRQIKVLSQTQNTIDASTSICYRIFKDYL